MMGIRPVLVTDSQPDLPRVACFGQCATDVPSSVSATVAGGSGSLVRGVRQDIAQPDRLARQAANRSSSPRQHSGAVPGKDAARFPLAVAGALAETPVQLRGE
jgi:hypothetical protein